MMTYYKYKKTMGVMILALIVYYNITLNPEWNTFLFYDFIHFLRWIDFPDAGWLFLDKYFYNGAL